MMLIKEFVNSEKLRAKKLNHPKFFTSEYFESAKTVDVMPVNLQKHSFLTLNSLGTFVKWNLDNIMMYMNDPKNYILLIRKHDYTTLSFILEKREYLNQLNSVYGLQTAREPDIRVVSGINGNVETTKPEKIMEKNLIYIEKVSNTLIDLYLKRSYV